MNEVNEQDTSLESAADWFVAVDAQSADPAAEARFAAWVDADPEHGAALARCEAAVALTRHLGEAARLGGAFEEAARLAAGAGQSGPRRRRWSHPAVAWSAAAASLAIAVLATIGRDSPAPDGSDPVRATAPAEAAYTVTVDVAGADSAVLLPGPVVVDARSVAVLPFVEVALAADDAVTPGGLAADLAASLYDEVVRQLASIPGVYVVDRQAVAPYAGSDIDAEQIAAQLGVRGVVEALVGTVGGRVQVTLRLTDAARAGPPIQEGFESRVGDLGAMRAEIVTNIALALADAPVPPAYVPPSL